jgi:serine/threonine protein kinase
MKRIKTCHNDRGHDEETELLYERQDPDLDVRITCRAGIVTKELKSRGNQLRDLEFDFGVLREVAAVAKISSSLTAEFVVQGFDFRAESNQSMSFSMAHFDTDLSKTLSRTQGLPADSVCELLFRLLGALVCAKHNKINHLDVKPGNIFLNCSQDERDERGAGRPLLETARLGDWGIARFSAQTVCEDPQYVQTVTYRAPEHILRTYFPVDATVADVWSSGLVAVEALLGANFYDGFTENTVLREMISAFGFSNFQDVDYWHNRLNQLYPDLGLLLQRQRDQLPQHETLQPWFTRQYLETTVRLGQSPDLVELLLRMLELDPTKRVSAELALQSPLFNQSSVRGLLLPVTLPVDTFLGSHCFQRMYPPEARWAAFTWLDHHATSTKSFFGAAYLMDAFWTRTSGPKINFNQLDALGKAALAITSKLLDEDGGFRLSDLVDDPSDPELMSEFEESLTMELGVVRAFAGDVYNPTCYDYFLTQYTAEIQKLAEGNRFDALCEAKQQLEPRFFGLAGLLKILLFDESGLIYRLRPDHVFESCSLVLNRVPGIGPDTPCYRAYCEILEYLQSQRRQRLRDLFGV